MAYFISGKQLDLCTLSQPRRIGRISYNVATCNLPIPQIVGITIRKYAVHIAEMKEIL